MTRASGSQASPCPAGCSAGCAGTAGGWPWRSSQFAVLGVCLYALIRSRLDGMLLEAEVSRWVDEGRRSVQEGQLELALSQFDTAARLAQYDWRLRSLHSVIARSAGVRSKESGTAQPALRGR